MRYRQLIGSTPFAQCLPVTHSEPSRQGFMTKKDDHGTDRLYRPSRPLRATLVCICALLCLSVEAQQRVSVERLIDRPIIGPDLHPSVGSNIQGPSLIRVPDWIESPLGRYYLYFADHKGTYIRLAYADELTGPWQLHEPGSVQIADSHFLTEPPQLSAERLTEFQEYFRANDIRLPDDVATEVTMPHIASPDVHVDEANQRIRMYFHGLDDVGTQLTRVAESVNGIDFVTHEERLGNSYMRAFQWGTYTYAMSMPGQFYRSEDGLTDFVDGPRLFGPDLRHAALLVRDQTLYVFWTQVGDAPEHIKLSTINLTDDWMDWHETSAVEVLRPEREWEGADAPLEVSIRGTAYGHVNQLRDPAIYEEKGRVFLLYAVAGESGIGIAELFFSE